jgi:S1-C subfamily serine protease
MSRLGAAASSKIVAPHPARMPSPRRGRLGWGRTPERVGFHLLPVLLLFAVGTLPAAASPQDDIALSRENALVRAIDRASPAVVNINSTRIRRQRVHTFFDWFEPRTQTRERRYRSLGSGAVFDAKHGYVLTNQHVIQGADEIEVRLQDGREFQAEVVGSDRFADLAVLKIDGKNLPQVELGAASDLRIGEWAIAIGNPFGQMVRDRKPTVTVGVISATDRAVTVGDRTYTSLIQTDAAVNPGNSGGPLVNAAGEVVGVNTFIFTESGGSHGVNFAISIDVARRIMAELIENGRVIEAWMGMNYADVHEDNADNADGAVITYVQPDGPADDSGLKAGDIITELDGHKVYSRRDAFSVLRLTHRGSKAPLTYVRGRKTRETTLVAGDEPDAYSFYGAYVDDSRGAAGAVVASIQERTVFEHVLQPDDVIYRISNVNIEAAADLRAIANQIEPGSGVRLYFVRHGQRHYYDFSI